MRLHHSAARTSGGNLVLAQLPEFAPAFMSTLTLPTDSSAIHAIPWDEPDIL